MLYGLEWLNPETEFPPKDETDRLKKYTFYTGLFDLIPFKDFSALGNRLYVDFDKFFDIPLLLGYQRLQTIKLSDMVIGSPPSITVTKNDKLTDQISNIRDQTNFDSKLYQALIDFSRYGVTVFRLFNDDDFTEDKGNFAVWNPREWFPIIRNDGTRRIKEHVLAWRKNEGTCDEPKWYLEVQRHPIKGQKYIYEKYQMDGSGTYIQNQVSQETIITELPCLVQYVSNLPSTTNIYGTSDYKIIDELVLKAVERMRQILHILDKHADPSMTGPVTMLQRNDVTGALEFKAAQFYAVSAGEEHPEYMTWDGQLEAAFKALDILLNQIYIMSEMGEALMGNSKGAAQAVSGTAMRYKMISPLEKARRVSNAFTLPIKKLISSLIKIELDKDISYQEININWEDSLPKDPREIVELTRLQTGAPQITPLKNALMENYGLDSKDAELFIKNIIVDQKIWGELNSANTGIAPPGEKDNPAAPPNPSKKGSINIPHQTGTANSNNRQEGNK